jgi:hypothetical protein
MALQADGGARVTIAESCDQVRGHIITLTHDLIRCPDPDKETTLAMARLVFELDRLADRLEELGGAQRG